MPPALAVSIGVVRDLGNLTSAIMRSDRSSKTDRDRCFGRRSVSDRPRLHAGCRRGSGAWSVVRSSDDRTLRPPLRVAARCERVVRARVYNMPGRARNGTDIGRRHIRIRPAHRRSSQVTTPLTNRLAATFKPMMRVRFSSSSPIAIPGQSAIASQSGCGELRDAPLRTDPSPKAPRSRSSSRSTTECSRTGSSHRG